VDRGAGTRQLLTGLVIPLRLSRPLYALTMADARYPLDASPKRNVERRRADRACRSLSPGGPGSTNHDELVNRFVL
jgi:hypothetical protein